MNKHIGWPFFVTIIGPEGALAGCDAVGGSPFISVADECQANCESNNLTYDDK